MGKTSFSGPVYGAKSLLFSVHADAVSSGTTAQVLSAITVPTGQDWYVTEVMAFRGSTGSTAFVLTLVDDTTNVASLAITSSLANAVASTVVTATAGEYEGLLVASGSSLSWQLANTAATGSSGVRGYAYGFIRFLSSTRSEG